MFQSNLYDVRIRISTQPGIADVQFCVAKNLIQRSLALASDNGVETYPGSFLSKSQSSVLRCRHEAQFFSLKCHSHLPVIGVQELLGVSSKGRRLHCRCCRVTSCHPSSGGQSYPTVPNHGHGQRVRNGRGPHTEPHLQGDPAGCAATLSPSHL